MAAKKGKDPKPECKCAELKGDLAELSDKIDALRSLLEKSTDTHEDRMVKAIDVYKQKGSMEAYVDTLDLTKAEKAAFMDAAMTRAKGAPPKFNPFRKGGRI